MTKAPPPPRKLPPDPPRDIMPGGYQPKAEGAPSSPPPNKGSAGVRSDAAGPGPNWVETLERGNDAWFFQPTGKWYKRLPSQNAAARANDHRLVQKPSPERPNIDAMVAAARGRPTEPEGAEAALGRFLANWRNRGRQDTDGVFARADLWHSVANVPVELLRELGVPKPKAAGKAMLVLVPLGLACAAMAALAAVVLAVLVAL